MPDLNGRFDEKFAAVAEVFERCFTEYGDTGASACLTIEGEIVLDLWGGWTDAARTIPWAEDTLGITWSTSKGISTIAALRLVERGLIDLDAPIANYWPEFAQNGKESITLRQVMTHVAGVPFLDADLPPGSFTDWSALVGACEIQKPEWEPGSVHGYHAATFGWIVGEVVRRVSGMTIGTLIAREIAEPLGAEYYLGLPDEKHHLVAEWTAPAPDGSESDVAPEPTLFSRAVDAAYMGIPGLMKRPEYMRAEGPAFNGYSNGRGLAKIYRPLANDGSFEGIELLRPETIEMAIKEQLDVPDVVLGIPRVRRGTGFRLFWPDHGDFYGLRVFGHSGYGGSIGLADPDLRISFGYVMNTPWTGERGTDPRAESLLHAAYGCIG